MMHDYMAIKGNSTRACKKQKFQEFLKMVAVIGVIVLMIAAAAMLTTI